MCCGVCRLSGRRDWAATDAKAFVASRAANPACRLWHVGRTHEINSIFGMSGNLFCISGSQPCMSASRFPLTRVLQAREAAAALREDTLFQAVVNAHHWCMTLFAASCLYHYVTSRFGVLFYRHQSIQSFGVDHVFFRRLGRVAGYVGGRGNR